MTGKFGGLLIFSILLVACEPTTPVAVGILTSDRIEVVAESNEVITEISVSEGDEVLSGESLLKQNSERLDIKIQEANANVRAIEELLAEQINGPRAETIAVSQASLSSAEIDVAFRENELDRLIRLRDRDLTSAESVDLARKLRDSALAASVEAFARLTELEAGTREEKINQTRHLLRQAQAQLQGLQVDLQRLTITTAVPGIVDSLPFEVGEKPKVGDVVAVLLSGSQPHARIYVPAAFRTGISAGDTILLAVDGLENPLTATVRWVSSDASFTPYYALTESDRGRLSYVAEIVLPQLPQRLPDGIPVEALFAGIGDPDDSN
jgi:HlyD family secretion protein